MPLTKLTPAIHDRLVESAKTCCSYKTICHSAGVHPGSFGRWLFEGKDPANIRQRRLRMAIKRARAEAEIQALKNIQTAGLDPARWQAAAWFLERCVRGRYERSAKEIYKPTMNVTMADIAQGLAEDDHVHHQNGEITSEPYHHQNGFPNNRISQMNQIGSDEIPEDQEDGSS